MLLTCNRSLAEYNLSLEPQLRNGREKLIDTYQNKETLEAQFERNKRTIGEQHRILLIIDTTESSTPMMFY